MRKWWQPRREDEADLLIDQTRETIKNLRSMISDLKLHLDELEDEVHISEGDSYDA